MVPGAARPAERDGPRQAGADGLAPPWSKVKVQGSLMTLEWIRADDFEAMSQAAAQRIAAAVRAGLARQEQVLLGLATGNTMLRVYPLLAEEFNARGTDLSRLHTVNLDEYVGADGRWVPLDHPLSYRAYMETNLFGRLDPALGLVPAHIHFPSAEDPAGCDAWIRALGGIDFQLLGIGFNGHIAFNEPMAETAIRPEAFAALPSRVIDLTEQTIRTNARLTAGGDLARVPHRAVTLGMAPILAAREVLLLACFAEQEEPLRRMRAGRPTPALPASYLRDHPRSAVLYTGDLIGLED